jgi:hypothetical protein
MAKGDVKLAFLILASVCVDVLSLAVMFRGPLWKTLVVSLVLVVGVFIQSVCCARLVRLRQQQKELPWWKTCSRHVLIRKA